MKERPIIFNGEMVRAILDGRKTQTRRVVKPAIVNAMDAPRGTQDIAAGYPFIERPSGDMVSVVDLCPYGQPGDRLWVRETWGYSAKLPMSAHSTKDDWTWIAYPELRAYKADAPKGNWCWKPSIHMPRWASRITLKVTGVRVERVQEISNGDAMAEGVYEWYKSNRGGR